MSSFHFHCFRVNNFFFLKEYVKTSFTQIRALGHVEGMGHRQVHLSGKASGNDRKLACCWVETVLGRGYLWEKAAERW